MVVSCGKESPFDTEAKGTLSLAKLMVTLDGTEIQRTSTRADVDVNDFTIQLFKDAEMVESYKYGEMPSVIELPVGDYTVRAVLGDEKGVGFDAPYYAGSESFSIREDDITEVSTIECKLSNVKVTVVFTDELKAAMGDDAKVSVVVGEDETLDFVKSETRSGYFGYLEGSTTMVATFTGMVDGVQETNSRLYTDVAPGTHYRITYTLHTPGVNPNASGDITVGLKVEAHVEVVDVNYSYTIDDPDRPTDDSRPNEGTDPDTPDNPGSTSGPSIIARAPISFDILNEVTPESSVILDVTSETGITGFTVDIVSDTLTPSELESVQLSSHLDLVNPGDLETKIKNLGLPVNVAGEKSLTFDISAFMPVLALLSSDPAEHSFVLTVTDAGGTTTRTLKLRMNP
jgi:hypothetical protein